MSALTAARAVEVTDPSGCAHLVTQEFFNAGRRRGRYTAMCTAQIVSASLTVEEREFCRHCAEKASSD